MPELTLRNIDQIIMDIRREEITFSHLVDDLTDHVCCDVEYEMQSGLDFTEAYQRVKQKMGSGRRLKEIQEETLYAVDSIYRKMKKTMKFSGIAGTLIFGIATMFKIQHWAGAGILLTLGALILAFVFMPAVTGVIWKETHSSRKLILIISGFLTGFLFISGTLFKIQHWPVAGHLLLASAASAVFLFIPALLSNRLTDAETKYKRPAYILGTAGAIFFIAGMIFKVLHWPAATVFMILGLLVLGVLAFPLYTWLTWRNEKTVSEVFIFMVAGFMLIVIPGVLINLNLQNTYESGFPLHNGMQKSLIEMKIGISESFLSRNSDSPQIMQMENLHAHTNDVLARLSGVEMKLQEVNKAGSKEGSAVDLSPGTGARKELESILSEYLKTLTSSVSPGKYEMLAALTDPSVYIPEGGKDREVISSEVYKHSLQSLKINVLTAEMAVLKDMTLVNPEQK